jgi:hypothetical protein
MTNWSLALELFFITIVGTFVVMGVLTMIISGVSKLFVLSKGQENSGA